jgi:hypothetical protein
MFTEVKFVLAKSTGKPQTVQQLNVWFSPSSTIKLHKYLGLYVEGQLRFHQLVHNQQHQARTGLEVYINDYVSLMPVGYVYTWNFKYGKFPAAIPENEHRMFEQVVVKLKAGRLNLNNRFRLEQRWIEHNVISNEGVISRQNWVYKNRFRYRLLANVPINKSKMEAKTFFFSVWDEMFVSFGKNVTYTLPDQNRIYFGFGYKFNASGTVSLGYMNQYLLSKNGTKAESNHTPFINFNYDFDLTKIKKKRM